MESIDNKIDEKDWSNYHYAGQMVIELMIKKGYEHELESEVLKRLAGPFTQKKYRGIDDSHLIESGFPLPGGIRKNYDFIKAKEILSRIYSKENERKTSLSMAINQIIHIIENPNVWQAIEDVSSKYIKLSKPFNLNDIKKIIKKSKVDSFIPELVKRKSTVPSFRQYFPDTSMMDKKQLKYYKYLVGNIENEIYPDVDGNISYLFTYVYSILEKWEKEGFDNIYNSLIKLSEKYYNEKYFLEYCKFWSYDCFLALEKYDDFLDYSEPDDIISGDTHFSNTRCNANWLLGRPANPVDLMRMAMPKLTNYTKKNTGAFKEQLEIMFEEDAKKNGPWLERMLAEQNNPKPYSYYLFAGAPISMLEAKFSCYSFHGAYDFLDKISKKVREAENNLRKHHRLPQIGEGWVSETALYYAIKNAFSETQIIQHGRPSWLGLQHFDIWIPSWKLAVEYHGEQHFVPVEFFGGQEGHKKTVERDNRKKKKCKENNVKLIIATSASSHKEVIEIIESFHREKSLSC